MEALLITDAVRYAHILSVAVGLGGSFMADLFVMTRLRKRVSPDFVETLETYHKLVWYALGMMWLTGLVLIGIRTGFVIENFTPKLFSKLFVVTLLTTNAWLIGKIAMPLVIANMGRTLLALPLRRKFLVSIVSGVSTTSWLLALALGVSKVLAASDWAVFILAIPLCYGLSMIAATGVILTMHYYVMNAVRNARMARLGDHQQAMGI